MPCGLPPNRRNVTVFLLKRNVLLPNAERNSTTRKSNASRPNMIERRKFVVLPPYGNRRLSLRQLHRIYQRRHPIKKSWLKMREKSPLQMGWIPVTASPKLIYLPAFPPVLYPSAECLNPSKLNDTTTSYTRTTINATVNMALR